MSMNFSEFKKRIGAEPLSKDPELLRARESSPEYEKAAIDAEHFEAKLRDPIRGILKYGEARALAAGVLVAVGAAGLTWKMNTGWDSVEEYLVDHYRHDGVKLVSIADESAEQNVQALLAEFNVQAAPELAEIVGVIKYCPTPDGKGVHMVLNTQSGPVTVIYMPETRVTDKKLLAFDGMEAILVELRSGSAAIIGAGTQKVSNYYAVIQESIFPSPGSS